MPKINQVFFAIYSNYSIQQLTDIFVLLNYLTMFGQISSYILSIVFNRRQTHQKLLYSIN